jgi:hypothetical protein
VVDFHRAAGKKKEMPSMKIATAFVLAVAVVFSLLFFSAVNPPKAEALPSYARQTGLPCSGCHYTPPELNPAGRRFKLTGYVDRADETKVVKADGSKKRAALDLLGTLPLSAWLEASFTSTKSSVPGTQNGSVELPQDVSLFLSGAWTSHVGSFMQVTYDTQSDHFSMDNTDIRYANTTKWGEKDFVFGLNLNNNPTVEDLWNSTPAWGFPFVADDWAPTPTAAPIISSLGQDVAGFGGYMMWNNHLYADAALYRSGHIGASQPTDGSGFGFNIRGVAPYWRVAWQQLTPKTQYEFGTYGMHMRSSPNTITGPEDDYTDFAFDVQIDRTVVRTDVLSWRATYIRENSNPVASAALGAASPGHHHLNTFLTNAEYHFGNKYSGTFGWFDTSGTIDPLLFTQAAVSGSANGDPRGAGYIANFSFWPWQNLQLSAQYTGYTKFNGGSNNYDGASRNASGNNTVYLVARFVF